MKLYLKECKKIAESVIYYFFIAILVFSWFQNFRGVTKTEINWEKGIPPADIGFERSLLSKPSEEDDYFGSKVSEDDPAAIMMGVTRRCCQNMKAIVTPHIPLDTIKRLHLAMMSKNVYLKYFVK